MLLDGDQILWYWLRKHQHLMVLIEVTCRYYGDFFLTINLD